MSVAELSFNTDPTPKEPLYKPHGTATLDVDACLCDLMRERRQGVKPSRERTARGRRLPATRLLAILLDHLNHDTLTRDFLRAEEGDAEGRE